MEADGESKPGSASGSSARGARLDVEAKRYTLNTLKELCRPWVHRTSGDLAHTARDAVTRFFEHYELRDDGLWVVDADVLCNEAERDVLEWHPAADSEQPALPLPFSAADLAAFMLAGRGSDLHEAFVDDETGEAAQEALDALGPNAGKAHEAITTAFALWNDACRRFGRTQDGVRNAAKWLLEATPTSTSTLAVVSLWTADRLSALAVYRAAHGTKAAAEHFRISSARVRELLPRQRAQVPQAHNPFPSRRK